MTLKDDIKTSSIFKRLSTQLIDSLEQHGIEQPTEIQQASFAPILNGKDLLGQSMTGSGKTLAFSLPLALKISKEARSAKKSKILILAPTRELAQQIRTVFNTILRPLCIKSVEIIGGASYQQQIMALKKGADVVIGTPGRVSDLIRQQCLPTQDIESFVLDEVDQMLDFGFAEDLNLIRKSLNKNLQTVLFSATLTKEIESLAHTLLNNPETIKATYPGSPKLIDHSYYFVRNGKKLPCLINHLVLKNPEQAIIFCETKKDCGEVASALVLRGLNASSLNSDLSQNERQQTMSRFRSGQTNFLVATNVAARGIDIQGLPSVINYNIPRDQDSYTHRSGRTGRAGSTGNSISIVSPSEIRTYVNLMHHLNIMPNEMILPELNSIFKAVTTREISRLTHLDLSTDHNSNIKKSINSLMEQIPDESAKPLLEALLYTKIQNLSIFKSEDIMCNRPIHFGRSSHRNASRGDYRRPPKPRST